MAVDVQERSQGFILYPKHAHDYPQPVPLASVPAAAGQLPAWEQKKLELEMASASVNGNGGGEQEENGNGGEYGVINQPEQQSVQKPAPPASQQLPKQPSSLRRSGSAFFASLRSSPSSKQNNNTNGSRLRSSSSQGYPSPPNQYSYTNGVDANGSTVQVHHDASGGIGTSPRASSKKRSSSVMLYLKKHFGIENHPEYDTQQSPTRSNPGPPPRNSSHAARRTSTTTNTTGTTPNKLKKSPSQRLAATSSSRVNSNNRNYNNGNSANRKTRSSGFADKMRIASGKMSNKMKQTWKRFNSKSNPEELPATWEEWRKAYARGQIDISDMPNPPSRAQGSEEETPYESQYLPAPMPEDNRRRQLAFNRLDIGGKRGGIKPSEIAVPPGEEQLPDTLEGHPAFREIVSRARETFDSAIAILTVFNENRQLFLAETGLGGMKEVPREVTFCSHAVLQQPPEPFILNDTHKDWRFAKSPLVQQYGCRAYYGVPLLAPDFSGSSDDPVPIGTLCIIDNKPRDNFTVDQRQKMNDLALLAQKTIANWSRARFRARLDAMERSFQLWKNEAASLADGPGSNLSLYQSSRENKFLQQQQQQQNSIEYSGNGVLGQPFPDRDQFHEAPGNGNADPTPDLYITQGSKPNATNMTDEIAENGDAVAPLPPNTNKMPDVKSAESYHTAPVSLTNKQKIYDISTRLVGDSLELTLVYILRLNLAPSPGTTAKRGSMDSNLGSNTNSNDADNQVDQDSVRSLSLVSSFGLPSPEPAFDAVLHMKALRSEEGGLLYQNPRADELRSGERMPQSEEVEYASALLVPVCESETSGYVLAGFTDDPERVFERSDLEYMTTIASELAIYLMD